MKDFRVFEEWGFIDRDTDEHRSLDLFAWRGRESGSDATIQPELVLLVECKRSVHPYVFFESVPENRPYRFPVFAGLPSQFVSLSADKVSGPRHISEVLGIDELKFIAAGPPRCATFTKGVANGKKVLLSGSDPFNSLVLPLTKARDHLLKLRKADRLYERIFPSTVLLIAVLDAPMLLVDDPARPDDCQLAPWIRIVRREASRDVGRSGGWYRFYTVDAVHAEYLPTYLSDHLAPFFAESTTRLVEGEAILRNGGTVASLDNWSWKDVRAQSRKA